MSHRTPGRWRLPPHCLLVLLAGAGLGLASCSGGGAERRPHPDAALTGGAGSVGTDAPIDRAGDGGGNGGAGGLANPTGADLAAACAAGGDCKSGFCFDGVCCDADCSGSCRSCAAQGSVGTCTPSPPNTDPRNDCADQGGTSCGTDGMCDGTGACRRYPASTVCKQASCVGATLTFASLCDGAGTCAPTAGVPCGAYLCGSDGRCKSTCSSDADCAPGRACVNGSCGPKPPGARCSAPEDCGSGFCEQGVCCTTACDGTCVSCAVAGSEGRCANLPSGQDPLGQCNDQGAPSCGADGFCDGAGACRVYVAGTVCVAPTCAAGKGTLPGTCDGSGICRAGAPVDCTPYTCGTAGVCRATCAATGDCATGFECIGNACRKRADGAACTAGSQCTSGFCQQGVCCGSDCSGICQSCALAGTAGVCKPIPAGQDPFDQCTDAGAPTCGTDGACNGAGACRLYAAGTSCGVQTCSGSTLTLGGRCDGQAHCTPGTSQPCTPYVCDTTGACRITCGSNADCTAGNVCTSSSCGLKPPAASCTAGSECASGFCQQNVCCGTACTGLCRSCAVAGSAGTCTTVPAGQDPLNQCTDAGAPSCGTDGQCDGAGACRLYAAGTTCAGATCSMSTQTSARTCNGAGVCQAATSASCAPFQCGASGQCLTTCGADTDCVSPNVCRGGTCTRKQPGETCAAGAECASGLCQQGVCCLSSCTGTCRSCALPGTLGTCTLVPAGQDPVGQCTDNGPSSCGTDGQCDGAGNCRLYAAGTQCQPATCAGSAFTAAATCNGSGACQAPASTSCAPFLCDTVTPARCKTTCATSADCTTGNVCTGTSCGKKPDGMACTTGAECNSGICAQSVCCHTACAGLCQSCALAASPGTCTAVPPGQDPLNQCADAGSSTCGTDGTCDGSGACRLYASGTVCVPGSCGGSALTPARTCNGGGTCLNVVSSSCNPYVCGTGACKTSCGSNADCLAPNTCTVTTCGGAGGAGGSDGGTGGCPGFAFCDDFEDGNANGWTPNGGNWAVVSDGTFVYQQSAGTSPAESFAGSSAWTDLTVQARMKVTQWGGSSASFRAGVYGRYRDTNTYYAAQIRADGKMEIRKKSAGLGNAVAVSVALGEWHTIKLQVSGLAGSVTVTGFLDGVMMLTATDSSALGSGAAAVGTFGSNTRAEFDDVKVSTP